MGVLLCLSLYMLALMLSIGNLKKLCLSDLKARITFILINRIAESLRGRREEPMYAREVTARREQVTVGYAGEGEDKRIPCGRRESEGTEGGNGNEELYCFRL